MANNHNPLNLVGCATINNQLEAERVFKFFCPAAFNVTAVVPHIFSRKPICRWQVAYIHAGPGGSYAGGANSKNVFDEITQLQPCDVYVYEKARSEHPPSFTVFYATRICQCRGNFRTMTMPDCLGKHRFRVETYVKAKEEIDELDKTGVQVLLSDLEKLEGIRSCELDITKERIDKIMATGVSVILSSGGIDDLCLKYFADAGAMAVIGIKKADLKRIAKATGAAYLTSLTNVNGEESFEAAMVGEAAEAVQERICEDELISIKGPKARTFASIILGGPNDCYFNEMDHDALCVVKRVLEGKKFVVGGGCVEAALSIYLENFTISLSSREELAISAFAKSLLVLPKTLAVNAAADWESKLRAFHNSSQTKLEHTDLKWCGLDLIVGIVKDNRKGDLSEPAMAEIESLKFANEVAILQISDIESNPEQQQGRIYADAHAAGES